MLASVAFCTGLNSYITYQEVPLDMTVEKPYSRIIRHIPNKRLGYYRRLRCLKPVGNDTKWWPTRRLATLQYLDIEGYAG